MTAPIQYTDLKNAQIVLALLKAHGIKRIVASPGTTNMPIVGSVQNDPWFEVYSGVDERHSAYMALGMSAATGEPVVLSCTGATASRNYLPAITEAYYRKIPILALTSIHRLSDVGNLTLQALDRSINPKDTYRAVFQCPMVTDDTQYGVCVRKVNEAILELTRHGGGPVQINMEASDVASFKTDALPQVRKITRYDWSNIESAPELQDNVKIALFVGSGRIDPVWDEFVRTHNAIVVCGGESAYRGERIVSPALLCSQRGLKDNPRQKRLRPDLIIDVGEVAGDYGVVGYFNGIAPVWRVSDDGDLKDRFGRLVNIFEMPAKRFVEKYAGAASQDDSYYQAWCSADRELRAKIPELPFSNPWIAKRVASRISSDDVVHFGILNSLRSWDLFPVCPGAMTTANVGGFGIDGGLSTLIGASLANPNQLHFGIFGDLAFFYDLNSLGNRHIGKNLRILLVNNGCGSEFNMYFHHGSQFGARTNDYIAAGGHFANKSKELVKHYVTDLGFEYLSADGPEAFADCIDRFFSRELDRPIVFECFTDYKEESEAHRIIRNVDPYVSPTAIVKAIMPKGLKQVIKRAIG